MKNIRGLTYVLKNKLYIALTNKCVSTSPMQLRGPSFTMPPSANFTLLETEPTAEDVYAAVEDAFVGGRIAVTSMDSDEITFAGVGEPLLKLDVLSTAAQLITENRHGAQLRVKTSGLILSKDGSQVATRLLESGVNNISISMVCDNPKQYMEIMKPTNNTSFSDMCSFVVACVEAGLNVQCTAVERPGVNVRGTRELAYSLGAPDFVTSTYYP